MQDSSCPQVLAAPPQVCTPAWAIHKAGAPPSLAAAPRETYEHEASGTARATAVPSLDQVYLVVNMCALQWRLAFSWRRVSVGHAGVAEAKKPPSSGCEERGPQSTKKLMGHKGLLWFARLDWAKASQGFAWLFARLLEEIIWPGEQMTLVGLARVWSARSPLRASLPLGSI